MLEDSLITFSGVDEAISAEAVDPTGGRGAKGEITSQLESATTDDMLKNAV